MTQEFNEMYDTRIKTLILPDRSVKFIPEVLIFRKYLDWFDRNVLYEFLNSSLVEEKYLQEYGRSIEWCPIIPSRSTWRPGWESFDSRKEEEFIKRAGYKTLKKAKEVLNAFKERYRL